MSKAKTLNWNDKLALIDYYKPDDQTICKTFGVTQDELDTARAMKQNGTFTPTKDIDYSSYSNMFSGDNVTSTTKPEVTSSTSSTVKLPTVDPKQPPQTATKASKVPKKRGRKGSKIQKAFVAIPNVPTEAETFANKNQVSIAVLRQSKRFDKNPELGSVKVKKDKETGNLMIWREKNEESTDTTC